MAVTPSTIPMIAEYHRTSGCPLTEARWLRIGLVLECACRYNSGEITEEDMHGMFDLAFCDHDDIVRDKAYELLPG